MATSSLKSVSSDAQDQIRQLRGQVDQLMRERVSPALSEAAGQAQDYARRAGEFSREQADALSGQVREMPIASVLIAAAVGYLLGRFTR